MTPPKLPALPRPLVAGIARDLSLTQAQVKRVCEAFLVAIVDEVNKGHDVRVKGFGTFHLARHRGGDRPDPKNPQRRLYSPPTERLALRTTLRRRAGQDHLAVTPSKAEK